MPSRETAPAGRSARFLPAAAAAIVILAVFLRWLHLGRASFFYDELYNVWSSKLSLTGMLSEQLAGDHPPLYFLVARGWYAFGTSEVWARSLSATAGLLAVLFIFLAARELFSRRAAFWTAAFAAASPLLIWYSRASTYYSFMIALATLSLWLLIRASKKGGWINWTAYTLAVAALLFTYFFGASLIAAGWLVYLFIGSRDRRRLIEWLTSQAALIAITGISYIVSKSAQAEPHRLHLLGRSDILHLAYDLTVVPFVLLLGAVDSGINYSGIEGLPKVHAVLFLAAAAIVLIAYFSLGWFRQLIRDRRMAAAAAFLVILVIGPLILQLINGGSLSGRFIVWAAPALLLILGAVIAAAPSRTGIVLGTLLLVALASTSMWEIYHTTSGDADWRSLIGIINQERAGGDRIIGIPLNNSTIAADYYLTQPMPITGGVPSIDKDAIYFPPAGQPWGGYKSGFFVGSGPVPPLSGPALEQQLQTEFAGASRLWVIEQTGLVKPGVQQALAHGWVEENHWDFGAMQLGLYVPLPE